MIKLINHLFLLIFLYLTFISSVLAEKTVSIVADSWCPYNCEPNSKKEGFGIEAARKIFEAQGYKINYLKLDSWENAIERTRTGEFDAIIGAYQSNAPDFIYPEHPFAFSKNCFYTTQKNQWQYRGISSLKKLKIGVIKGYSYGKNIDNIHEQYPEMFFVTDGNNALELLFKQLVEGRIDTLIEDSVVVSYNLNSLPNIENLRVAGCQIEAGVYIAFSPSPKHKEKIKTLLDIYNTQFLQLMKSNHLTEIYNAYR